MTPLVASSSMREVMSYHWRCSRASPSRAGILSARYSLNGPKAKSGATMAAGFLFAGLDSAFASRPISSLN